MYDNKQHPRLCLPKPLIPSENIQICRKSISRPSISKDSSITWKEVQTGFIPPGKFKKWSIGLFFQCASFLIASTNRNALKMWFSGSNGKLWSGRLMSVPDEYSSFVPGTAIIIHEHFNSCSWITVTFSSVFRTTIHLFAALLPLSKEKPSTQKKEQMETVYPEKGHQDLFP